MKKLLSLFLSIVMIAVCSSLIAPTATASSEVSVSSADEITANVIVVITMNNLLFFSTLVQMLWSLDKTD